MDQEEDNMEHKETIQTPWREAIVTLRSNKSKVPSLSKQYNYSASFKQSVYLFVWNNCQLLDRYLSAVSAAPLAAAFLHF